MSYSPGLFSKSTSPLSVSSVALTGATSGIFTQSVPAIVASYGIIWPSAQASGVQVLTNDGSGNLSWASGSAGASSSLNNLSSTAVNTDINPASNNTVGLGTSSLAWDTVWAQNFGFKGSTSGNVQIAAAATTASYNLVLPAAQASGVKVLQNDGAGNLSWATASGGSTVQTFTLSSDDITNKYITLSSAPVSPASTVLLIASAPNQFYAVDFTVSGNLLGWNTLALDGILAAGDNLTVLYS